MPLFITASLNKSDRYGIFKILAAYSAQNHLDWVSIADSYWNIAFDAPLCHQERRGCALP